jgi:hypothetical protein
MVSLVSLNQKYQIVAESLVVSYFVFYNEVFGAILKVACRDF